MSDQTELARMRDKVERIEASLHQSALLQERHQGDLRVLTASVAEVSHNVGALTSTVGTFDTRYAPKSRFELIEKVVFGACVIILAAFVSALVGVINGTLQLPGAP